MTSLPYDPGDPNFWPAIRSLPGFPRQEAIPLRTIRIESGALYRLAEALDSIPADRSRPLLVVMDPAPMRRGGEALKPLVLQVLQESGWRPDALILQPDASGQVHTDLAQIQAVKEQLSTAGAALALGSGVVTDITKHACCLYERETGRKFPFAIYQTANSVNAYTSNMAPTFIDGVKRTLDSRYADALVCDLETLRDAPAEMTVAGVGDLLAAFVSFPDWYLAHRLGLDSGYSRLPQELMGPFDVVLEERAGDIRGGSLEATALLARLIHLSGLCMSLAHATTPFSGYEHVISHILDLQNELAGRPLAAHGSQVALAAMLGVEAYRDFLETFDPTRLDVGSCYPPPGEMQAHTERAFGAIDPSGKAAAECWRDYAVKLEAWHANRDALAAFRRDWPEIRQELAGLTSPAGRLAKILASAGGPVRFDQLQPAAGEAQVRFAFFNAPLMRKRLTIGDALIFFGWDRKRLWKQVWGVTQTAWTT